MGIRRHYTISQSEKSGLFHLFLEIHTIGGVEDEKAIDLPCFVSCWVPQHHPHPIEKQGFKGSIRPW